jgi:ATP-dependent Clp protease ATP-binding subunit ClpC
MATYRYPVLVWQDAAGIFTAALVGEFEDSAGRASTEAGALRQLKEFIEWRFEETPWSAEPEMAEAELIEMKIEIRPQYEIGKRIIPCPETVWMRVPCVTGVEESGLRICVIPHLSVAFNYQDAAAVKSLAAHYVKEELHGYSPAELAICFPPQGCRLEELVVRHDGSTKRIIAPADRPELKTLFAVADPLLHDTTGNRSASAAYGREALSETLARKLRGEKSNLLLIGPPGIGKTTLILDAARRFTRESKADGADSENAELTGLRSYKFWRASGGRLIAGMRYLGEWEERCEEFLNQLSTIEGVFCAENLLELLQTGGQGAGDSVAAFLLPYLQRGELRMIAETTPAELEAIRRLLPGLLEVFHPIHIPEFPDDVALDVLRRVAHAHASAHRAQIEPTAISLTHRLFKRFQPYFAFPGPAAHFIKGLFEKRGQDSVITNSDVIARFVKDTGLPELFLRDELPLAIETVRAQFDRDIIGQPEATRAAAQLIASIKAGMTDPARPYGALLFCGPTGVGKTALAKALEEFCFGAGAKTNRLVRLDMSEYSGWGAAQRFLQNADGRPAQWIERVRLEPFSVVLFDEIEKAAPDVFDALLGLLDEGRLTDRFGRVTWFRSAIVIMTSNIGASAGGGLGFMASDGPSYEGEVSKFFRPEFFNRLDGVIAFRSLSRDDVQNITRKELRDLAAREGLVASSLRLVWSEPVVELLSREGYDHRFGARPLQRAIERLVATPLARWLVANPKARQRKIHLDLDANGEVTVR